MPVITWLLGGLFNILRLFGTRLLTGLGTLKMTIYGFLLFHLGAIITKTLIALGFGTVTYLLGGFALDVIYSQLESQLSGLNSDLLKAVKMSGITDAMQIVFGALSARLTYSSLGIEKKTMTWNA